MFKVQLLWHTSINIAGIPPTIQFIPPNPTPRALQIIIIAFHSYRFLYTINHAFSDFHFLSPFPSISRFLLLLSIIATPQPFTHKHCRLHRTFHPHPTLLNKTISIAENVIWCLRKGACSFDHRSDYIIIVTILIKSRSAIRPKYALVISLIKYTIIIEQTDTTLFTEH